MKSLSEEALHIFGMKIFSKQAQLAGDGTYPWGEKFHGKNLLNQKRIKNDKSRKYNKWLDDN